MSIFKLGLFSNKYVLGAIVISTILQVSVVAVSYFNSLFKVTPLNLEQWLIVAAASIAIIPIVEAKKLIVGLTERKNS
jgi:Ca2+-transporting ATPase